MQAYIVVYRLPLLSRAYNSIRIDADSANEAVRMCCMEIPSASIEDVWAVDPDKNNEEQFERSN